jgi:hypothetical protein
MADQDDAREFSALAQVRDKCQGIIDKILEAKILDPAELWLPAIRAALVIAQRGDAAREEGIGKFFSVAGLTWGPLPSRSVGPEPAIRSATGGCMACAGTVRTESMAPMASFVSSAEAFMAKPTTSRAIASRIARERINRSSAPLPAA